jgi:hypothetical protein
MALDPHSTPASSPENIYIDEYARKLVEMKRIPWHMPEYTIADVLGFESVRSLRLWVGSLKRKSLDVWQFNAYEDKYFEKSDARYWIIGGTAKPTPKDAGIPQGLTVQEQREVTDVLQRESEAVRFGIGETAFASAETIGRWHTEVMELCFDHPKVFHLHNMISRYHDRAHAERRPSRREIISQFIAQLKRMLQLGVFRLSESAAAGGIEPRVQPPPSSGKRPAPRTAKKPDAVPRQINFKNVTADSSVERQSYEVRTRIAMILMTQCCVSQVNQPKLLAGILRLWGHELVGDLPTRNFAQSMLAEGGVLANSVIGQQILDWGLTGAQDVTACIDAVSIGEWKGEAASLVKPILVAGQRKFVRIATPLLELANGSDDEKQSVLVSSFTDIVDCYNAVNCDREEETGDLPMSLYDVARILGFSCNDHAESVVHNQFAPWVSKILEQRLGVWLSPGRSRAAGGTEDVFTPLWCMRRRGAPVAVRCRYDGDCCPALESVAVADRQTYLHAKATSSQTTRAQLPIEIIDLILQMRYDSPDVLKVRRSKLRNHGMYCQFHSECVVVKDGVKAVSHGEKEAGGVVAQQLAVEARILPQTKYSIAGGQGASAIYSTAKSIGKPKRTHETLSHGALIRAIKEFEHVSHSHFERLLGSRGDMGLLANAGATLTELLDSGAWGAVGFLQKLDAKSGSTNELHSSLYRYARSDVTLAQLRVYQIMHTCVVRPMQTFTQNHSTQANMVSLMHEYKQLLQKLKAVTTLTASLDELPWLGTGEDRTLISVACDPKVLRSDRQADTLLRRRREAMATVMQFDGHADTSKDAQLKIMCATLTQMASGMLQALARMMHPKYGDLWSLTAEQVQQRELHLIPATSDSIERYFGLASWITSSNPNLTRQNANFTLSIIETKLGDKLTDLYLADPKRTDRMLRRARQFKVGFAWQMEKRKRKTLAQRVDEYRQAEAAKARRQAAVAAELVEMQAEARTWTHRELSHRSERKRGRWAGAATAAVPPAVPTVKSLVSDTKAALLRDKPTATENQQNAAAVDMLVRWLTVFSRVHELHKVAALEHVFYAKETGRLRIRGAKTVDTLMQDVAACSAHLEEHGSPTGFLSAAEEGQAQTQSQ